MTVFATRMGGWLPTGLTALVLGGATLATVAPAQAQYYVLAIATARLWSAES